MHSRPGYGVAYGINCFFQMKGVHAFRDDDFHRDAFTVVVMGAGKIIRSRCKDALEISLVIRLNPIRGLKLVGLRHFHYNIERVSPRRNRFAGVIEKFRAAGDYCSFLERETQGFDLGAVAGIKTGNR